MNPVKQIYYAAADGGAGMRGITKKPHKPSTAKKIQSMGVSELNTLIDNAAEAIKAIIDLDPDELQRQRFEKGQKQPHPQGYLLKSGILSPDLQIMLRQKLKDAEAAAKAREEPTIPPAPPPPDR